MRIGRGSGNGLRHFLKQGCLTCLRRGHNHTSLPFTHRTHQIHDPHCHRAARRLQFQTLIRENRRHILESHPAHSHFRRIPVDCLHIQKRAELLVLRLDPRITLQNVSRFQTETADLAGRHIDVVFTGQIVLTADKAETVTHNLQNTTGGNTAVKLCRKFLFLRGIRPFCRCIRSHHRFDSHFLPCRLVLLILFKHRLHDLCLLHGRSSLDPSGFRDLLQVRKRQRFILFSHKFLPRYVILSLRKQITYHLITTECLSHLYLYSSFVRGFRA